MKRFCLVIIFTCIAMFSWAQNIQQMKEFQTTFESVSAAFAPTLLYNATVGDTWSSAYIGNFPHWGVGFSFGAAMVPLKGVQNFTQLIPSLPTELINLGLPLPATALSAKIGGFGIPFDIGLKGMYLPQAALKKLLPKVDVSTWLVGFNFRYGIFADSGMIPAFSVGVGYTHLEGNIFMEIADSSEYKYTVPSTNVTHTISATAPKLGVKWASDSVDFTAQVSKKILFIEPFFGIALTAGKSNIKGGILSKLFHNGTEISDANLATIKAQLQEAGINVPNISATELMFSASSSKPVFRLYGGLTIYVFMVKLETLVTYVPQSKSLGLSCMLRVQM